MCNLRTAKRSRTTGDNIAMSGSCQHPDAKHDDAQQQLEEFMLQDKMGGIRHKLLVLSGKGGVGKSTVAANLAVALANAGQRVGLLDVDIHGPSIPKLLGVEGRETTMTENEITPIRIGSNLSVMSIGFLLADARQAVIWRGPRKFGVIRQFLAGVQWGELDYLVVDSPPGTGDEPLAVAELVGSPAEAVVVTTPQDLAIADVRRCVSFCADVSVPVAGIVENMSGLLCPHCGQRVELFKTGGGKSLAEEMKVPFLGSIPLDPNVVNCGDAGTPFINRHAEGAAALAFAEIVRTLLSRHKE